MKKFEETIKAELQECKSASCLSCAICKAAKFEERRKLAMDRSQHTQLYAAELLSYYFHFSSLTSAAK
jgi:hypothetical protein